ncbi:hypothetical protein DXG01_011160 [Tephrocybe rancida]|nr:hypothetical protein DXG01_011160 [Tephrocybe rancida]
MSFFQATLDFGLGPSVMGPSPISRRPLYFPSGRVVLVVDDVVLRLHLDPLSRGSDLFARLWAERPDPGRSGTMIRLYNEDPEDVMELVDAVHMFDSAPGSKFDYLRRSDGTLTILPNVDRCILGLGLPRDPGSPAPRLFSVNVYAMSYGKSCFLWHSTFPGPIQDFMPSLPGVSLGQSRYVRRVIVGAQHELGRDHIWHSLPGYFGLEAWDGLFDKDQESVNVPPSIPIPRLRSAPYPDSLVFADGNFTIVAGDDSVPVHAMVMARESSVFASIWRKRPHPSLPCVVSLLNDTGATLMYLTNALYNVDRHFLDKTPMDMSRFLSLLHMSLKYHYHSLLESLVLRVIERFPSDVTELDYAGTASDLELAPGDEFDLIRVAGNFGFSSSLLAIYYRLLEASANLTLTPLLPAQMHGLSTSRPTFAAEGSTVKLLVPPGWSATVTAVGHKTYHQLVVCECRYASTSQNFRTTFFSNEWETPDAPMHTVDNSGALALVQVFPQGQYQEYVFDHDDGHELEIRSYHSQNQAVSGEAMRSERYRSSQVKVLMILVEDALSSEKELRFEDLSVTIHCTYDHVSPNLNSGYNLSNIQGDILPGLPGGFKSFYYFQINNALSFHRSFTADIMENITTAEDLTTKYHNESFRGLNVAFTPRALYHFGKLGDLQDDSYNNGQKQDAQSLGDAGSGPSGAWTPQWDDDFIDQRIDGVFIITGFTESIVEDFVQSFGYIEGMFRVLLIKCKPRPEPWAKSDHFGYRGGISNPQVKGVTYGTSAQPEMQYPGSPVVPMGVLVMGYDGDKDKDSRPDWAKDGAFLVTRKLNTRVPEFENFMLERGHKIFPDLHPLDAADHLGARLFGRWKDGTPTELSPDKPDPSISGDDKKVNNFTFDQSVYQHRCPFAAHIRKSNPRGDVSPANPVYQDFMRHYITTYGPEVSELERSRGCTLATRGQHFVSYSSSIVRGFKQYQCGWYNQTRFPPNKNIAPGMDPIVGQTGKEDQGVARFMTGTNPSSERRVMIFPIKFVEPRGGEYFFVPSIQTMAQFVTKI